MQSQQFAFPHISCKDIRAFYICGIWIKDTISFALLGVPQRRNTTGMVLSHLAQERQCGEGRLLWNLEGSCHESFGEAGESNRGWDSVCAGEEGGLKAAEKEDGGCLEIDFVLCSLAGFH